MLKNGDSTIAKWLESSFGLFSHPHMAKGGWPSRATPLRFIYIYSILNILL
jgi:hypothetical protein